MPLPNESWVPDEELLLLLLHNNVSLSTLSIVTIQLLPLPLLTQGVRELNDSSTIILPVAYVVILFKLSRSIRGLSAD